MDLPLRALTRDDVDALVELALACEEVDHLGTTVSREMVASQFEVPGIDITRCVWVLPAADGGIAATVTAVPMPTVGVETVQVGAEVRPDHREQGLEEKLLCFAETQAPRVRKQPDLPAVLHTATRSTQTDRTALYERLGYRPVRWFLQLERSLGDPIAPLPLPEGFRAQAADAESDAEALHLVVTDSFRDHWSTPEFTVEQFRFWFGSPAMQPLWTLLARDADGEPAGVCAARVKREKNEQQGTREGDIAILGVRRPYRGRGLARALLLQCLGWLRESGMTVSTIDVDADSPTGANRLYESVGFAERRRTVVYEKVLGRDDAMM